MILHATGLQTLLKLIENDNNNLPLGYSFGRSDDNNPLIRLLTPNFMKLGRLHSRTLSGPVRLPSGPGHMMKRVEDGYKAFFKLWNEVMVPHLIKPLKWFRSDRDLMINDVVYFQKSESDLTSVWTVGQVEDVVRGKDALIRRVLIRYFNTGENKARYTDRALRSVVKLFDLHNTTWREDMDMVQKMIDTLGDEEPHHPVVPPLRLTKDAEGNFKVATQHAGLPACGNAVHVPLSNLSPDDRGPEPDSPDPDHLLHTHARPSCVLSHPLQPNPPLTPSSQDPRLPSNSHAHCSLCCCPSHCQLLNPRGNAIMNHCKEDFSEVP